uniref:NB-ARC domain-containing protein n=1 Tax=Triticum urartu TaxID=4572 RepID=A0A8R7UB30_TRIUA
RETQQGQPKELKVISIVGLGRIGKTLLASHLYDSPAVVGEYEARAWVRAAEKGVRDVLREILRQLGMQSTITSGGGSVGKSCCPRNSKLCASLRECLGTKRY